MRKLISILQRCRIRHAEKQTEIKSITCNYGNDYYGDRACKTR